ncbi:acid phosphatase type 7 [Patella vulgata]|uniref:acid phosphatase type 7 n=1 Tax=Patella vulgata TaxID=6465 RepID=UPI00217FEFFA|nr:acid phosphatase type 7 [Patella vulgata]XP_050395811.1 acid phosphatase type 7 [Patella vulgata]XP_050395812.1 acid phosphatase type 7 [Patella vulgata]XP_055955397.1 acid phosphatase type 7 [Patella vulgata]
MLQKIAIYLAVLVYCVEGLGGGCILQGSGLGNEYSVEATALRYQEEIHLGSGPVQGIHLSLTGLKQTVVTWLNPTPYKSGNFQPTCNFGESALVLNYTTGGEAYTYPDGMFQMTLNKVRLNFSAFVGNTVYYKCGDIRFGYSPIYNFTMQKKYTEKRLLYKLRNESPPYFGVIDSSDAFVAVIGDHGVTRGEDTANNIADHVKNDNLQLIVHAGDISYADKFGGETHNNSYIWVSYMNLLQPATAYVPYMTTPGNHERQYNFSAYLNWLGNSMPYSESESGSPFWYSFDYMGIHFVAFSTEHDFMPNSTQYHWMEKDLLKANSNRVNSPWIVVFGHRPLYCTSLICMERCEKEAPVFRSYLEDLLYQQHVDVVFAGHNHQYERSYPVYKLKPVQLDYKNPKAPVYIVNGAAGNPELNDPSFRLKVDWRAFDDVTFDTGYILMQPTQTELRFQYMNSNKKKIVDQFVISKASSLDV